MPRMSLYLVERNNSRITKLLRSVNSSSIRVTRSATCFTMIFDFVAHQPTADILIPNTAFNVIPTVHHNLIYWQDWTWENQNTISILISVLCQGN